MTHTILKIITNWAQREDELFVPEHQYEVGMYVPSVNGAAGECCWHAIARYNTAEFAVHLIFTLNGGSITQKTAYDQMMRGLL